MLEKEGALGDALAEGEVSPFVANAFLASVKFAGFGSADLLE
jgi:hypothetical protein